MWQPLPPEVYSGGCPFPNSSCQGHCRSPIPTNYDAFSVYLRGVHHLHHPGAGTYLDSRRFTVDDLGTDAVDRHGACLGVIDAQTLQGTARHLGRFENFGRKYGIELFPVAPITTQLPRSAVIPLIKECWNTLSRLPQRQGREYSSTKLRVYSQQPLPIIFGKICYNFPPKCVGIRITMLLGPHICLPRTALLIP
jgi:hypothetical protein